MKKVRFYSSVRFRFVLICVLLVFISMQIISVYFARQLEEKMINNFKESVSSRINLWAFTVENEMRKFQSGDSKELKMTLNTILEEYISGDITQIVVFNQSKEVISSVNTSVVSEDIRFDQYLIDQMFATGEVKYQEVVNNKENKRLWVTSVPITDEKDNLIGFIYVVSDIEKIYMQVKDIYLILQKGTLFSLLVTAIIGLIISVLFTRPISAMRRLALAMSEGNYDVLPLKTDNSDEIGLLSEAFNVLSKKLKSTQKSMESEKQKLASILMNMSDGVIATDEYGKIILINMRALTMLNIEDENTVIGSSIVSLLDIEKEFSLLDLMERNESLILDYSDNIFKRYFRAHFSVINSDGLVPIGLVTVLHDVTEQEKIEEDRKEFVANVSHELRTPLTTMRSYLEALSDEAPLSKDLQTKFLRIIQSETNRMIRLVNELLSLSKLEDGQTVMMLTWTDFVKFFDKIVDRFQFSQDKNITFVKDFPEFPVYVEIDCDKIIQVIDNIISNALKYSYNDKKIFLGLKVLQEKIEVSIRDEGIGMPKGNAEKIFERFYRVDKARSRRQGGSGLGLAIAKEIISMHKGEIYARSLEGIGTTIIFTLPYTGKVEGDDWE